MPTYSPDEFAAVLMGAIPKAAKGVGEATQTGARRVEAGAKRNVRQSAPRHNSRAFEAINHDMDVDGFTIGAEIGYDRSNPSGHLGILLEFGGGGDHSPPHYDLSRALWDEEGRYVRAIADAAEKAIE